MTLLGNRIESTIDLSAVLERSALLSEILWVRHGITRRLPGLGRADGNVGYSAPRDAVDAWRMRQLWAQAIEIDPHQLVRVAQVHGATVHVATESDLRRGTHPEALATPIGDAIITNAPGIALSTLHADCLATLIVDPVARGVGTIHAGWRGTVADIAGATVRAMSREFGSKPQDLLAYVGPSISAYRYEVGEEVANAWSGANHEPEYALERVGSSWRFDLKRANTQQLMAAGVRPDQIEVSHVCTASDPDNWFSHRAQGPHTGRFATMIAIRDAPGHNA